MSSRPFFPPLHLVGSAKPSPGLNIWRSSFYYSPFNAVYSVERSKFADHCTHLNIELSSPNQIPAIHSHITNHAIYSSGPMNQPDLYMAVDSNMFLNDFRTTFPLLL